LSLVTCGLLALAGCATDNNNRTATPPSDPLLGGPPISGRPTPGQPTSAVTPPPASRPSTSPAALAPGAPSSIDNSGGLRIPGGGQPLTPSPSTPPAGAGVWRGQGSGGGNVSLSRPEAPPSAPATPPAPPTTPPAASPPAAPPSPPRGGGLSLVGTRTADVNPLLAVLRQRGATFQRLETWGDDGEWKFSCAIPNRQNPAIRRTYEAKAGDPLVAVRAVIDQIDKEQR
jgi:hypothetical protein